MEVELTENSKEETQIDQQCKDFLQKVYNLKIALTKDLVAFDAKWSLFVAAASGYRYETQLEPISNEFKSDNEIDIENINRLISDTLPLKNIGNDISQNEFAPDVINLIHWVLIDAKDAILRTTSIEERGILYERYLKGTKTRPQEMFEITYPNTADEKNFLQLKNEYGTNFGFYTAKTDSFYSLLHSGFKTKDDEQFKSIDLHSDILECIRYDLIGATWGQSVCGSMMLCVAICEYIDNSKYCKKISKKEGEGDDGIGNTNANHNVSINKSEFVRPRYLLFYNVQPKKKNKIQNSSIIKWFTNHKLSVFVFYALLIAAFSLSEVSREYLHDLFCKKPTIFDSLVQFFKRT